MRQRNERLRTLAAHVLFLVLTHALLLRPLRSRPVSLARSCSPLARTACLLVILVHAGLKQPSLGAKLTNGVNTAFEKVQ